MIFVSGGNQVHLIDDLNQPFRKPYKFLLRRILNCSRFFLFLSTSRWAVSQAHFNQIHYLCNLSPQSLAAMFHTWNHLCSPQFEHKFRASSEACEGLNNAHFDRVESPSPSSATPAPGMLSFIHQRVFERTWRNQQQKQQLESVASLL